MILYSFKPIGRQETPNTVVLERFNIACNKLIYIYNFKGETMKRKINKPILLSALALTQSVGTVMLVQNSIVQAYAEQKNKEVTSQEFLDYINQLKEQNPDFKFSQGETKVFESEEQALAKIG